MKKTGFTTILGIIFIISPLMAADYVIIVNKKNPITSISKGNLKRIYQLKMTTWDNSTTIQPVNLDKKNPIRIKFSEEINGKSPWKMAKYYLRRALSGKGQPPKTIRGSENIILFVSSNEGAIGYASNGNDSVKVIPIE